MYKVAKQHSYQIKEDWKNDDIYGDIKYSALDKEICYSTSYLNYFVQYLPNILHKIEQKNEHVSDMVTCYGGRYIPQVKFCGKTVVTYNG